MNRLLALVAAAIMGAAVAMTTGTALADDRGDSKAVDRSGVSRSSEDGDREERGNRSRDRQNSSDRDDQDSKNVRGDRKNQNSQNGQHNHGSSQKNQNSKDGENGDNNGLDILGRDCGNSDLPPHDGFEKAPRCVNTSFGEVSAADKNPTLLITDAPREVRAGEKFTITVSTRNLVRDRFLPAAQGGYYLERSTLNEEGIQRGHFHTACRMLTNPDEAPDPNTQPDAFVATEDGGGGAGADTVTVEIPGLPTAGEAQCATWAGDGSHRIPMMQRANQTPAFDAVRITVN